MLSLSGGPQVFAAVPLQNPLEDCQWNGGGVITRRFRQDNGSAHVLPDGNGETGLGGVSAVLSNCSQVCFYQAVTNCVWVYCF